MSETILIVDDEQNICELLKMELEMEGYACNIAYDGPSAIDTFHRCSPDLIILDLMLPGMSGIEVCKQISDCSDVPIIMLTAKSETADKITGLETGADDYITKPFETRELLARVRALIRRYKSGKKPKRSEIKNQDLVLFPDSQTAYLENRPLKLTVTEFDILVLLTKNKDKVYSRETIFKELGMNDFQMDTRSIDMHIQRLRKKIATYTNEKYIETVFGIGYKMRDFDEPQI
ncbi:MAG: response regulator transcription factor [Anaerofustis sp.]